MLSDLKQRGFCALPMTRWGGGGGGGGWGGGRGGGREGNFSPVTMKKK